MPIKSGQFLSSAISKTPESNQTAENLQGPAISERLEESTMQSFKMKAAAFVLACVISFARGQSSTGCQKPADVVAVVDGSGSVGSSNFLTMKNVLSDMVDSLAISQSQVRLAVVVYASSIQTVIPFSNSATSLKSQINALSFQGGGTSTHLGISNMTYLFSTQGRVSVAKIGMVFTDGYSSSSIATALAADAAKAAGVNMFSVGIGSNTAQDELEDIASSTGQVVQVSNFQDLLANLTQIIQDVCSAVDKDCNSLLDVVAVVDGSGSIATSSFEQMRQALQQMVTRLRVSDDGTRLGVIVYSDSASDRIDLSGDKVALDSFLSNTVQPKGGTATHLGIAALTDMIRSKGRRGVAKVGLVLTDGISNSPTLTADKAKEARDAGVSMFSVGIGAGANQQELAAIASSSSQVVNVTDFNSLLQALDGLVQRVCSQSACNKPLELMAIVDGSGSIPNVNFRQMQSALSQMVDTLSVAPDKIRLGFVVFSSTVSDTVPLSGDPVSLKSRVQGFVQPSGGTATDLAIAEMVRMMQAQARPGVSRVAMVFTDGASASFTRTSQEAQLARDAGINMFAVGVGNGINQAELKAIASADDQVLLSSSFNVLFGTIQSLINAVCLKENPCDACMMRNGAGYNTYPPDCTRYVQCTTNADGEIVGVIKNCPAGLFWDQSALTCNHPYAVQCASDKCQHGNVSAYTFPGHCQDYWTCPGGVAQLNQCPPGTEVSPSFTCVPSTSCGAPITPPITTAAPCLKTAVPGKPDYYLEAVVGFGWMERPCAPGTVFSAAKCDCIASTYTAPATPCSPELYLPFTNGVTDASGHWTWVQNDNVAVTGGLAVFNGNAALRVLRFTNYEFGKDFVVSFRYNEQGGSSSQPQALVTNADCGKNATLYVIRTSASRLTFGYVNDQGQTTSVTVSYSSYGWRTVEFRVSNGVLTGKVNGVSNSASGTGPIARSQCALQFGGGFGYSNFSGQMDDVRVYLCAP